jgi:hypothetical protein
MKIQFSSNWGQFNYTLSANVPDGIDKGIVALVAQEGLANLGFRACGSNVEKAFVKAEVMDKSDKRNTVAYSEANGKVLQAAAQATLDKISVEEGYPEVEIAVTGEHVFGEAEVSRKMALALLEKASPAMKLALGIDDKIEESDAIEKAHAFLATLRAPKKAKS